MEQGVEAQRVSQVYMNGNHLGQEQKGNQQEKGTRKRESAWTIAKAWNDKRETAGELTS